MRTPDLAGTTLDSRQQTAKSLAVAIVCAVAMLVTEDASIAADGNESRRVSLTVVDCHSGEPVRSRFAITPPDDGHVIGSTDHDEVDLSICRQTHLLQARPIYPTHHYSFPELCHEIRRQREFRVMRRGTASRLQVLASVAAAQGDFARALPPLNELRWTVLREGEGVSARSAEILVYEYTAHLLGVNEPVRFDPAQGRQVMSPALREAVVVFQRANELTDDGILGPRTLRALHETHGLTEHR